MNAEMGEGLQEIQDRTGLKRWQVIFGILGELSNIFLNIYVIVLKFLLSLVSSQTYC